MPDLDYMGKNVIGLTKKIQKDLKELLGLYKKFQGEIETRFREELQEQNGKMDGLEDFYGLNLLLKRNFQNVGNSNTLMSRLKDFSGFDISETDESPKKKEEKEVEKILEEEVTL
jgi:hypothetical protein